MKNENSSLVRMDRLSPAAQLKGNGSPKREDTVRNAFNAFVSYLFMGVMGFLNRVTRKFRNKAQSRRFWNGDF